jgi:pyrimidine precursor biosynthesis enzyme
MRAVKQGSDYLLADPAKAWAELKAFVPEFNSPIADKIFERSLVYMSRDLANVPRDWTKVTK